MLSVPVKERCRPTLWQLLRPFWRKAPIALRVVSVAAILALIAAIVAAALRFAPATFSRSGTVPFSFVYTGLYRTAPEPGEYVKVVKRSGGRVIDSFAVGPLKLPPYSGGVTAELPLYAAGYERSLARRLGSSFRLDGEGVTAVKAVVYSGYQVFYSVRIGARTMYGRDVMLLPERSGAREGVLIRMLSSPEASTWMTSPTLLGSEGILYRPLETFTFG